MIFDSKYIIDKLNEKLDDENLISTEENLLSRIVSESKVAVSGGVSTNITNEDLLAAFSDLRLKLAEHMKLDSVVFLFGNGVSIYAGSKDTRDFDIKSYKAEYPELDSIIDEVAKYSGIEDQLNSLITIKSYYNIVKDITKEGQISSLISDIKNKLIGSFVNSVEYRNLYLHEMFLLKLRAFNCLKRTNIYTTNYDLAFEYSLDKLSIMYNDGFSGFVNRVFDSRTLQDANNTSLVKIHGSVNWSVDNGIIKEFQPRFVDVKVVI
jgi:hypothetical protein